MINYYFRSFIELPDHLFVYYVCNKLSNSVLPPSNEFNYSQLHQIDGKHKNCEKLHDSINCMRVTCVVRKDTQLDRFKWLH